MTRLLIGVDLGGTNIRAAVATGEATHRSSVHRATPAAEGPDAVLAAVVDCVREAAGNGRCDGLAIGIPGPLDPANGIVYEGEFTSAFRAFDARTGSVLWSSPLEAQDVNTSPVIADGSVYVTTYDGKVVAFGL